MAMIGTYDPGLVALSVGIAMLASYTALRLAVRAQAVGGWSHRVWVSAAAAVLGGGIWSMHFVGMLAFSMPGMMIDYDPELTLLSLAFAVGLTGVGFAVAGGRKASIARTFGAGVLMGSGILAMHYTGMAAMRMPATITYSPIWIVASIAIAIGAATTAIWLAPRDRSWGRQFLAASVMGLAISGMHYVAMQAAHFEMLAMDGPVDLPGLSHRTLAGWVSAVTLVILLVALGAASVERAFQQMARREARAALRLEIADLLRAKGPQALEEICALMGHHFDVNRTGYGQLDPDEDIFDYDVCWTDGSVPPLLGRFPAAAFGVKIVAALNRGETIAIGDLARAPISDEELTQTTSREVDTKAILVVPFVRGGRLRTIVYLNARESREWQDEDVEFLEELAERTRLVIEREKAEDRLRELNATLEARVKARSDELQQAQEALLQSRKMEALGQLVSGLAHDFNNVLGAIVGAFQLIERRIDQPDQVRRFASAGLEAADRGARLTAQLLTFSRGQRIDLRPLFVCDVIDSMTDMLARALGPMIEINYNLNRQPVPVLADPIQVEMMLLNLAINARDAMPDGGSLTISTAIHSASGDVELADGNYVELRVADTGTGMDETTLLRALEPFYTTKPAGKGTGLGLAQIYGSARQAGGTVRLESELNVGTVVRVLLPITDRAVERLSTDGNTPKAVQRRVTVLLVDDDHALRDLVASALEAHGHEVIAVPDGPTALSTLEASMTDVAVVDYAMPGMTGAALAGEIIKRWPNLPILFASGFSDTAAIESAIGNAPVLKKPFRIDELLHAVEGLLNRVNNRSATG